MPQSWPTPRRLRCAGCGIDQPVEAFPRLFPFSVERAQPCNTCKPASSPVCEPGEADPAARAAASTAAGLVAQALAVCEQAGLDGPVVLLTDTLICLVEDWGAQT